MFGTQIRIGSRMLNCIHIFRSCALPPSGPDRAQRQQSKLITPKLSLLHSWCQIDSGVKLTLLYSWCQIGPVSNWLRCQIGSGAKLVPVPNCPPIQIKPIQSLLEVPASLAPFHLLLSVLWVSFWWFWTDQRSLISGAKLFTCFWADNNTDFRVRPSSWFVRCSRWKVWQRKMGPKPKARTIGPDSWYILQCWECLVIKAALMMREQTTSCSF